MRRSPGVNEGKLIESSNNRLLVRHAKGLRLWDTGVPDAVAAMLDGFVVANGAITYRRVETLASPQRIAGVLDTHKAQFWISHGKAQAPVSPAYSDRV